MTTFDLTHALEEVERIASPDAAAAQA